MRQRCIICGNKEFETVIKIKEAPLFVGRMLDKGLIEKDKNRSLTLLACTNCALCQIKKGNLFQKEYYKDYQMSAWIPKQLFNYQRWLAQDFIKHFDLKGKNAFEIGCGDGRFASVLCRRGLRTIGIEPSTTLYNVSRKKIRVLNQYFNNKITLKKKFYDAFVARQVFEHLSDPGRVLYDAKIFLKPDGVGLIEVPSFLKTIKDHRYYDIFTDHFAYYTEDALRYLLASNNFRVIKIFKSMNDEYLVAYFKNTEFNTRELESFSKNYASYIKSIKRFFGMYKNKKIAVWGAGGKGVAFLSALGNQVKKHVRFVIDSDPHKCNKYIPGSHIPVIIPKSVNFDNIDLILISAATYQSEIIKDLRNRYKYNNKIGVLAPKLQIF